MEKNLKKVLLIFIILSLNSQVNAQSKDISVLPRMAVLNFKTENLSHSIGITAPDVLSKELVRLAGNKYLSIISRDLLKQFLKKYDHNKQNCYDNLSACAFDAENDFNADKRVVGFIKNIERETGKKKLNKYVLKELQQEEYKIYVKVVDIKSHRIELELKENIDDEEEIDAVMKSMAKKIIKFYSKPVSEKVKIKETVKKSSFKIKFEGISASGAFIKTLGKYKNIGDYGYGINIGANIAVYPLRYLAFCLGLYSINSNNTESIKSDYNIYPQIKIGHCFSLPYGIKLIPYAGGGYIISAVKGDKNGADPLGNYDYSTDYYYNPACSAGLEIDYFIWGNIFLFLNPSYSIFFEKGNNGQFLEIALGLKRSF